jgi:hypothetical protein
MGPACQVPDASKEFMRILVVEDDKVVRDFIERVLIESDFDVDRLRGAALPRRATRRTGHLARSHPPDERGRGARSATRREPAS